MRKLIWIVAMAAAVASLAGCAKEEAKNVDSAAAAAAILEEVTFQDTLVEAEGEYAEHLYGLDDTVAGYSIYVSGSGATAEEIAVIKMKDAKDLNMALTFFDKRIADLKFNFEDYVPGEMVKLENPVIVVEGDAAALVIADDYERAKQSAEGQLK